MKRFIKIVFLVICGVGLYMIYPRIGYYWHYWLVYDPPNQVLREDFLAGKFLVNLTTTVVSGAGSRQLNDSKVVEDEILTTKKQQWPSCRKGSYCIIIPRIGVNMPIYKGGVESLEKGAWQQIALRQPGRKNNFVVTAHRFKWLPPHQNTFYNLDKLRKHDRIIIRRQDSVWVYVVSNSQEVSPSENWVLKDSLYEELTLYTCAPLWGDSRRLIIKAFLHENL